MNLEEFEERCEKVFDFIGLFAVWLGAALVAATIVFQIIMWLNRR